MQPFRRNRRQTGIGISKDQKRIRLDLVHQLVGAVDDISNCRSQIIPHCVHINFRVIQFQITEKDAVQVVIIVLSRMGQNTVKIAPALVDHRAKPDNLRTGSNDN